MGKVHNYRSGESLIKRYSTITLKEIQENWGYTGERTAHILTGFGQTGTCTLCRPIRVNCSRCLHNLKNSEIEWCIDYHCMEGASRKSYKDIEHARTPRQLLNAFRRRAKYLQDLLNSKRKIQIKTVK